MTLTRSAPTWTFAGTTSTLTVRTSGSAGVEVDYAAVVLDATGSGLPDAAQRLDLQMPTGPPGVRGTPLAMDPATKDAPLVELSAIPNSRLVALLEQPGPRRHTPVDSSTGSFASTTASPGTISWESTWGTAGMPQRPTTQSRRPQHRTTTQSRHDDRR